MLPARVIRFVVVSALVMASASLADAKQEKPYRDVQAADEYGEPQVTLGVEDYAEPTKKPATAPESEYGAPSEKPPKKPTKAPDNEYGAPSEKPTKKPTKAPDNEYGAPSEKPPKKPSTKKPTKAPETDYEETTKPPPKKTKPAKTDGDYGDDGGKDQDQGKGNLVEISLSEFADGKLVEPKIRISKAYMKKNPAVTVHFKIQGVKCDKNSVKINKNCPVGGNKPIKCKPMGCPDKAKNGQMIDVPVTFDYEIQDAPPRKQEKQIVQRKVRGCGRCHGQGDPHMSTFDDATFDFHTPGTFKYFEAGLLKIHIFQDTCKGSPAGCIRGAAIAYGESVVRFLAGEKNLEAAKGTEEMKWLTVKKLQATQEFSDGYRVVVNSDDATSFVDVNMGTFNGAPYLNVNFQGSSAFQDIGTGLMGNWNGNKDDDETNPDKLKEMHKVENTLFTCEGCEDLVQEPSEDDLKHLELSSDEPHAAMEGYDPKPVELELRPLEPKIAPKRFLRELFVEASQADIAEAGRQCDQVIKAIPHCDKYVNQAFFIESVCKGDFERMQTMDVIDNTKIAYLRDCRRAIDGILDSSSSTPEERAELEKMRGELQFGSPDKCSGNCSGKGTCAPSGCKCNNGFTGMSCETTVSKPSEGAAAVATDSETEADANGSELDDTAEDPAPAPPSDRQPNPPSEVEGQEEEEEEGGNATVSGWDQEHTN